MRADNNGRRGVAATTVLVLAAGLLVGCSSSNDDLQSAIDKTVQSELLREGAWSIQAVDLNSGETVYELNPTAPLVPGSIQKTFTTGTALAELGPEARITTPVYGLGETAGTTLTGDLVLVGRGDFSFGLRDREGQPLKFTGFDHNEANTGLLPVELTGIDPLNGLRSLATQIAAKVQTVTGDVVIDNRLFEPETEWPDGRIDSIWVNENVLDVVVAPGVQGAAPQARTIPALTSIQLANRATTVPGDDVELEVKQVGEMAFELTGTIGVDAKEVVRNTRIDDPVAFARNAFRELLADAGVQVGGSSSTNPDANLPPRESYAQQPLATFTSGTTTERVTVVQKVSYNRGADLFACLIAVKRGGTDCVDGVKTVLDNTAAKGAPKGSVFLFDPAGSIDYNRVSARGQVGFLRGMLGSPEGKLLRAAMPVAGVDGSLAELGRGTSSAGKISAKTGTRIVGYPTTGGLFYAAQSYAGYLTTASGRDLAFAVIFNAAGVDGLDSALALHSAVGVVALALQQHG